MILVLMVAAVIYCHVSEKTKMIAVIIPAVNITWLYQL